MRQEKRKTSAASILSLSLSLSRSLFLTLSLSPARPLPGARPRYMFVAVGSAVRVVSTQTGQAVRLLEGHAAAVSAMCLNPCNALQLLTASADGTLRLWDFEEALCLRTMPCGAPVAALMARLPPGQLRPQLLWVAEHAPQHKAAKKDEAAAASAGKHKKANKAALDKDKDKDKDRAKAKGVKYVARAFELDTDVAASEARTPEKGAHGWASVG